MANRILTTTFISVIALTGALGLVSCVAHEMTIERNGEEVSPKPPVDTLGVDACSSISEQALAELNLDPSFANEVANPEQPGCNWQGRNANAGENADLDVWLTEPAAAGDSEEYFDVGGATVGIWYLEADVGRYVVSCGEVDVIINYIQNHGPLAPAEALDAVAPDVIAAYGCGSAQ